MATSKDGMDLLEEERDQDPFPFGIPAYAENLIEAIEGAIETSLKIQCSEIEAIEEAIAALSNSQDKQECLTTFDTTLRKILRENIRINEILGTITSTCAQLVLALNDSNLTTMEREEIEALNKKLLELKQRIAPFIALKEQSNGIFAGIPSLFTENPTHRKKKKFDELDSDSYDDERTSEETRREETDTASYSFVHNSLFTTQNFDNQSEKYTIEVEMDPFPKTLLEEIMDFDSSLLPDENVQNALTQIKSIAEIFEENKFLPSSMQKFWRGYITLLEDYIAVINQPKEKGLIKIRDGAIALKLDLLKLYAKQVFEIDMTEDDVDLREILEQIIAIENAIEKIQKQDSSEEQLEALKTILKTQNFLIWIPSKAKQSSKNLGEKEASASEMRLSEEGWREHITELKRAVAFINRCENISADIKSPAVDLPSKLLALYAKQVFEIDITEDDLDPQSVLEHIIAIKNAIDEARQQDSLNEQVAALEMVLREEDILKEKETNIEIIHTTIQNLIDKLNAHHPSHFKTLKNELNVLKKEIASWIPIPQKHEEEAVEDNFWNDLSDSTLPYGSPLQRQTDVSYSGSSNGQPPSEEKKSSEWEDIDFGRSVQHSESFNGGLPPSQTNSSSPQRQPDVPRRGPSNDEDNSAGTTSIVIDPPPSSSPLNSVFAAQAIAFFEERLKRLEAFEKNNETAYKVIRGTVIVTVVVGVVVGVTAATWGIAPAVLLVAGAIAAHAAITEGVFALGALCTVGFFGYKYEQCRDRGQTFCNTETPFPPKANCN